MKEVPVLKAAVVMNADMTLKKDVAHHGLSIMEDQLDTA